MGRSQVVRHRSLEPAFVGSNPPAPATFEKLPIADCRFVVIAGKLFLAKAERSDLGV